MWFCCCLSETRSSEAATGMFQLWVHVCSLCFHVSSHSPKTSWLGHLETQSACRCECVCQITCMLAEQEHEEKVGMFLAYSQHSKKYKLNRIIWLPYLTTFELCHSLCWINMFLHSAKQHFELIQVSGFYHCIHAEFKWSTIYATMVWKRLNRVAT